MKQYTPFLLFFLVVAFIVGLIKWERSNIEQELQKLPAWNPPGYVENEYKDVCRIADMCSVQFNELRWFVVNGDTLPQFACGTDKVGCFILDAKAIILTHDAANDIIVIRHELMHAALSNVPKLMDHHCKYFNLRHRTWWYTGC
jgi:hypothetical protein